MDYGYATLMHNTGSGTNWHKDILNAWTPENKNTDIPLLNTQDKNVANKYYQDRYLISSNYLSVNNITLGYTLPKSWTQKLQLSKLRLYFVADNVGVISARKGLDPRQSYTTSTTALYTPIRTISGGINLTF